MLLLSVQNLCHIKAKSNFNKKSEKQHEINQSFRWAKGRSPRQYPTVCRMREPESQASFEQDYVTGVKTGPIIIMAGLSCNTPCIPSVIQQLGQTLKTVTSDRGPQNLPVSQNKLPTKLCVQAQVLILQDHGPVCMLWGPALRQQFISISFK